MSISGWRLARDHRAAAFVSIHLNASDRHTAQGTETWLHTRHSARSKRLADHVQARVLAVTKLRDRGVKAKGLGVLSPNSHDPQTACCLVEVSFLDRVDEEQKLLKPDYQNAVASAIGDAVGDYLAAPAASSAMAEAVAREAEFEDAIAAAAVARRPARSKVPRTKPAAKPRARHAASALRSGGEQHRAGRPKDAARNAPSDRVSAENSYIFAEVLTPKRQELLHELVPTAPLVAMLVTSTAAQTQSELRDVQAAAGKLGQQVRIFNVSSDGEIDAAFAAIVDQQIGGLIVQPDQFFTVRRDQLVLLTTRHAIPTIFGWREFAVAGGLMSYGTSLRAAYRQIAMYAGRILKGEKPADLPVQQATAFEMVVNLKAAKALGVTIPTGILLRADEVIE